jgi:Tol biopolymer transport system component
MKHKWVLTLSLLMGLSLPCNRALGQGVADRFYEAVHLEEVKGDLEAAISLYQKVMSEASDRSIAAKAQLHIGMCYEKLGKAEAQKAYERVVRDYADQAEPLMLARARLAALRKPVGGSKELGIITRQVWGAPEADSFGTVSPDGRYLSFTDWGTGNLAIRDLETGTNRLLTNKGSWLDSSEYAEYSTLSPDGKQVAYAWWGKNDLYNLRVIGLDGAKPRTLYVNADVEWIRPATWLPDGKQILATFSKKDGTQQIALVGVADSSVRVLKTLDWRLPEKMSISPDGRYIAYDLPPNEGSPSRDIFLLSIDGKRESTLIEHPADDRFPVWTPDGKRILFASDRTGSLGAWVIPVADGKPQGSAELVKQDLGGKIIPMGFTREGGFYYGLQVGMTDVYIASLDLKTGKLLDSPRRVTERFVGSNSSPDWSPDGRHLAYISRRGASVWSGSSVVCIRSLETGEERDLLPKLNFIWTPRWSPDGRSILLLARDTKERRGLSLMDVQSGDVTPLLQAAEGEYVGRPMWSPDGKAILYERTEPSSKKVSIVVRELETGQEREVCRESSDSLDSFDVSPNGKWLVYNLFDQATSSAALKVVPSRGGVPRELVRVLEQSGTDLTGLAWTRDGLHVLFTKLPTSFQHQKSELLRVSAEGGEPQQVGLAMELLRDVRVDPDGRRIVFTAGPNMQFEVWVMENFLPTAGNSK